MAFDSGYKFIIAWNVSMMVIYPYYRPTGSNAFLVSQATGIGFCLLGILFAYSLFKQHNLSTDYSSFLTCHEIAALPHDSVISLDFKFV